MRWHGTAIQQVLHSIGTSLSISLRGCLEPDMPHGGDGCMYRVYRECARRDGCRMGSERWSCITQCGSCILAPSLVAVVHCSLQSTDCNCNGAIAARSLRCCTNRGDFSSQMVAKDSALSVSKPACTSSAHSLEVEHFFATALVLGLGPHSGQSLVEKGEAI